MSVNLREVFVSFVIEDDQILNQIDQLDNRVDDLIDKITTLDKTFESLGRPLEGLSGIFSSIPSEVDIEFNTNIESVEEQINNLFDDLNTKYAQKSPIIPDIGGLEEAQDAIDGVIVKLEQMNRVFSQINLSKMDSESIVEAKDRIEDVRKEVELLEDEFDEFTIPEFGQIFPESFVAIFEDKIEEMFALLRRESELFERQLSKIDIDMREVRTIEEHIETTRGPEPETPERAAREEVITPIIEDNIDQEITEKLGQIELDIIQPVTMIVEEMPPIELDERQLPLGVYITDESMSALDDALDIEPKEIPLTSEEISETVTAGEDAGIEPTYRAHETIAGLELAEYTGIPELEKEEPKEKVRLVEFKPEVNIGPVTVRSEADLDNLKEKVMESLSELIHEEAERRQ